MDYKALKRYKFDDYTRYETEYMRRFKGIGTNVTALYPYVYEHRESLRSELPLFCSPLREIQLLSQEILENSRAINELSERLPEVAHQQFYQDQMFKSIISTDEIEGIHTTRKELAAAYLATQSDKKKKVRLQSTVQEYADIISLDKIDIKSLSDIRRIYDRLTEGEIEEENLPDGQLFRNVVVRVGKHHTPPETEAQIMEQLSDWIQFINNHDFPFLIRATLGHFFFENTHPFSDGNGRTGRYILVRYLSKKLDKFSGLILSQKINENRAKYDAAFEEVEIAANLSEGTFFVKTMLDYLAKGQKDVLAILTEKDDLLTKFSQKLKKETNYTEVEKFVLFLLYQSQLFVDDETEGIEDTTMIKLARQTEFPMKAVKRAIKSLEEKEEIESITQRPLRHRIVHEELS